MKQHWKIIGIYAIINILMLAGCKEKRVDYTIEGQTETPRETEQSAGTAGVGQFADAEGGRIAGQPRMHRGNP